MFWVYQLPLSNGTPLYQVGPEVGPTSAFYSMLYPKLSIPTGMRASMAPTRIVWANRTRRSRQYLAVDGAGPIMPTGEQAAALLANAAIAAAFNFCFMMGSCDRSHPLAPRPEIRRVDPECGPTLRLL